MDKFLEEIKKKSELRIDELHHLAKRIWKDKKWTPIELRNKCMDAWDDMSADIDSEIIPLFPIADNRPISNIIFGSGSFSTANFQIEQFERVKLYAEHPPVHLQGIVANKSQDHQCQAQSVSHQHGIPLIELDFQNWYNQFIDKHEKNAIRATRYWYSNNEIEAPSLEEINNRFKIRQNQYHKSLGEKILKNLKNPVDIASLRGYNFQICSNLFPNQKNRLPHVNDTHPADLSYINSDTKEKLYAGWQTGAIQLMKNDKIHQTYRGSLIEVEFMDSIAQIHTLDEGALLALSQGININPKEPKTAKEIQNAMKLMDDYFYCTLEPTGLMLLWGITKDPVPVVYQSLEGKPIVIKQRAIVVGNRYHSGMNAWGKELSRDLQEVYSFLFP